MMRGLCLAALYVATASGEWAPVSDRSYSVKIKGAVAGTMRFNIQKDETGKEVQWKTSEEMSAEVERGKDTVKLHFVTNFVETTDGTPVNIGYVQNMATEKVQMNYDFTGDKVEIVSRQGELERKSEKEKPSGAYLSRLGVLRLVKEEFEKDSTIGKALTYRTIKPEMGPEPVEIRSELKAVEEEELLGAKRLTSKWETTVTGVNLVSSEWYYFEDDNPFAVLASYSVNSAMGELLARIATAEEAQAALDNEEKRPELVHTAYVPLKKRVRGLQAPYGPGVFIVSTKDGSELHLPTAGFQKVEPVEGKKDTVRVTVNPGMPLDAEEGDVSKYLEATAMIDGTDPEIIKLQEKVQQFVQRWMYGPPDRYMIAFGATHVAQQTIKRSNLATGFASSSEVVRKKTGDCSEYAVLLAAILRSFNIPSRTCSGLVYIENEEGAHFGWHMWVQALLPPQRGTSDNSKVRIPGLKRHWLDFDATVTFAEDTYTIGHILFGTSAMSDAEAHRSELKLVSMIGNLEIKVEESGPPMPGGVDMHPMN